jgi:archaellum biogenesis protein FlaJ (TadC family)
MKERLLDVMKWGLIIIIIGGVLILIAYTSKGQTLMAIAMLLTSLATVAIAIYAGVNYNFTSKIQSRDEEFKQDLRKLYRGIVISTLIAPSVLEGTAVGEDAIKEFNEVYEKGETGGIIFKFP